MATETGHMESDEDIIVPDDVIDSIAMLTGMSIGDIRSAINDDNYVSISLMALSSFRHSFYQYGLGTAPGQNNQPVIMSDEVILTSVLRQLEVQLNEPNKTIHEYRTIEDTIENLKKTIVGFKNNVPIT